MALTDPRVVFSEWLNLLWAEAGKPTYDKLARDAQHRVVRDPDTGRTPTVSKQRISAWKTGSQVPREFTGISAVLAVLITDARRRKPHPAIEGLYNPSEWKLLWHQATAATEQARRGETTSPGAGPGSPELSPARDGADQLEQVCPYRGLAAFEADHTDKFFGRASATADLVARVDQVCVTGAMLMLVAPSGAGKSSLLGAGLLPAIRAGRLAAPDAQRWPVVGMAPGPTPCTALAEHIPGLADLLDRSTATASGSGHTRDDAKWENAVRAAITRHARSTAGDAVRVVLVIDQFEELFTLCEDDAQRQLFIDILHAAAHGPDAPALVLLGMRADFYSQCLDYPPLLEALQDRQMVLAPMTTKELREAITRPATACGLRVEPGLVDLLIRDAGIRAGTRGRADSTASAGTLPLLSHALRSTWQRRQNGRLSIAGYNATGGIHGAVTQTAERALATLTATGQVAAMNLLLRLVRVGEDHTQDTRRRRDTAQLLDQSSDRNASAQALEAFVQARLITVDTDTTQIAHEALLHTWPRLRKQIDHHRVALLGLQRLEDDAHSWAERDRDPSRLYRGDQLTDADYWAHRAQLDGPGPSGTARDFLDHAIAARDRDTAERLRRAVRDRRVRTAIAALAVFGLVVAGIAILAEVKASQREDDANFANVLAQADRLQSSDPSLAAQLDLVAHRMRPDNPEVAGRILSTQNTPLAAVLPGSGNAATDYTAFSPDGRTLATASNTIQLWDLTAGGHPRPAGPPLITSHTYISAAAFTPDSRLLTSTGGDGILRIWDVSQPTKPAARAEVPQGHGASSMLAVHPDGHTLASGGADGTVTLWNITDAADPRPSGPPLTGHTGIVRAIAFSPDGSLLAAGGDDNTILLYDVSDPTQPVRVGPVLDGHTEGIRSVAFSPDGRLLASGGDDKSLRMWNLADPTRAAPIGAAFGGQKGSVWSVAFSPNGRTLASGSQDGTTKLWTVTDPSTPNQLGADLFSRTGGIYAVGFSHDGRYLATGGDDGTTQVWTLPATLLAGPTSRVFSVAFSPDGRTLAIGYHNHSIWLWNITNPRHPTVLAPPLLAHNGIVTNIAFSPDGRTLASSSGDDRTTRLSDLTDATRPVPIGAPMPQRTQYQAALAFTPDGRTLVTSDTDTSVRIWDITDKARPTALGTPIADHRGFVQNVAISPHTTRTVLAIAGYDGTVTLWDITNPALPTSLGASLQPGSGKIRNVTFSPDGHTLAVTGEDKTIRLWNVTEPAHPVPTDTLLGHNGAVLQLAFTPDGSALASGGADKAARVWNLAAPQEASVPLTGHLGRVTAAEFSPDGKTLATGGDDNTVRLWNLNLAESISHICFTTEGALDAHQWNQLLPRLPYKPACSP